MNPIVEQAYETMKALGNKAQKRDEHDVFGEHVACQIRNMKNAKNKAIARNQINQILFKIEMDELDYQQHRPINNNNVAHTNENSVSILDNLSLQVNDDSENTYFEQFEENQVASVLCTLKPL